MKRSFTTALIAAVVSAVVAAGAAVATTQTFVLGTTNHVDSATLVTNLNGTVKPVDAALLTLDNRSTSANATPLSLQAAANHAPLRVNTGVKVANLNADRLDGVDSTGFMARGANILGTLSISSILAHHCYDLTLSVGGAQVGQVPLIAFQVGGSLPNGLMFVLTKVASAGHVEGRLCNPTDTDSVAASQIPVRIITLN